MVVNEPYMKLIIVKSEKAATINPSIPFACKTVLFLPGYVDSLIRSKVINGYLFIVFVYSDQGSIGFNNQLFTLLKASDKPDIVSAGKPC